LECAFFRAPVYRRLLDLAGFKEQSYLHESRALKDLLSYDPVEDAALYSAGKALEIKMRISPS